MNNTLVRLASLIILFACLCPSGKVLGHQVVIGNNRITFITDHLVRLEYANNAQFLNDSTLFAIDQSPREVKVKTERKGRK